MGKNLNFAKENLYIMFKTIQEYKLNFYIALFEQFFFFSVHFIFFYIVLDNFSDVITWTLLDFILFGLIADSVNVIQGFFHWGKRLQYDIVYGHLNILLVKPINVFFAHYFSKFSIAGFTFLIVNVFVFIFLEIFFNFYLTNILLSLFFLILIIFLNILLYFFIRSFNFFSFGFADFLIVSVEESVRIGETYPHKFFENSFFGKFLLFSPIVFVGSLIVPLIRGYDIWNFDLQIIVLFSLIVVFSLGTLINWYYGLKKYEAFG